MNELKAIVERIATRCAADHDRGKVATYIPELADVDPNQFGISVVTADGADIAAGDADVLFSIQSVSKVFALTTALAVASDNLWHRVGREPSGNPFNSIVQLERESGVPRNPLINAGAIVVADVILDGRTPDEAVAHVLDFIRQACGDDSIDVDTDVALSEQKHGARNRALAHFMSAYGNLHHPVEQVLSVYFSICAIAMSCRQLARAGRYLAWDGRIGPAGDIIASSQMARRINALMLTCGHYDGSGEFAYQVGIPGKSGVGGGILAVVPGIASIGVWSPGLNEVGNSKIATQALEQLAAEAGWSIFKGKNGN